MREGHGTEICYIYLLRKQKVRSIALPGLFLIGLCLAIPGSSGSLQNLMAKPAGQKGSYVRVYDLYDARLCYLTPQPFLCKHCLESKKKFIQVLQFEPDGRPVRSYRCQTYRRPYLD